MKSEIGIYRDETRIVVLSKTVAFEKDWGWRFPQRDGQQVP